MPTLRVGTYNGAYFAKVQDSDLGTLLPQLDIVGLQEFSRQEDEQSLKRHPEWAYYYGLDRGNPVAWRKSKFDLLDKGSLLLSPRVNAGPGAGPDVMGRKHGTWVKLRHKDSGRIFYFMSCHLMPSIQYLKRYELHDQQTDRIRDWAKSLENNVIIVGDFNIDAGLDAKNRDQNMPFVKFGKIGIHSTYRTLGLTKVGTLKDRRIDYIFYLVNNKRIKPLLHKVIGQLSSDHRALIADFDVTLTARKRAAQAAKRMRALTNR